MKKIRLALWKHCRVFEYGRNGQFRKNAAPCSPVCTAGRLRQACSDVGVSKLGESIRSLLLHRIVVKLCGDGAADFYPEHVECTVVSVEKTDAEETERIIESARSNGAADACGGMNIRLAVSFLKDEKLLCFEEMLFDCILNRTTAAAFCRRVL